LCTLGDQPEAVSWAFDRIRELRNEAGRPAHFELWVRVPPPTDRQAWRETIASYASAGATGVLVEAGPRLLDTLRNPDVDIDRDDLHLAQG
jgi:hypothetical protein